MQDRKLYILNLEDNPNDTELIQARLEQEGIACEIARVETESDYVAALEKGGYDLLLVDYKLPGFDGLSALALAKEKCPDIPFVFVSGSIGEDVAIEALKHGSTDYVLKERLSRLAPAVRRALQEARVNVERRQAENVLRELSSKLELILNSAGEGIYGLDMQGRVTFINSAAARMLGWERDDLIGRRSHETWHHSKPDNTHYPAEDCGLLSLMENGIAKTVYDAVFWRKDGTSFPVEYTTTPIFENEKLIGAVVSFMDETGRKKLEEQLRQSQKMEAIGTLTGGIAHDFNNMLNVILGYGALVWSSLGDEHPSRPLMNEVLNAAEKAANLTKRLLTFSRKQVADMKPVDVNEIVVSIEKMLRRIIGEDIELITKLGSKKMLIMADFGQMEQVLMNLAVNARDAMPAGGSLAISTELKELDAEFFDAYGYGEPGRYALIQVSDSGVGIDAETQSKIFEPFFTTKGVGEGTGLGLSMAYGILKQHNGYIKFYSEAEKGTTFNILIPLTEDAAEKEGHAGPPVSIEGGRETILVAEDDVSLRKLSRIVLESFGYSVITAEDGEDAIKKYTENRDGIQLVILDMIMPKKSGREAYEEIRKINPDIRAIFASGYTTDLSDKKELLVEGMDFLHKPVSSKDLLRKVREVLDR